MGVIKNIQGYELLDSRGNPTVYVEVETSSGAKGFGYAPSGASTGKREAVELRDGGKRYGGMGVLKCLEALNNRVKPALLGQELEPALIDSILEQVDGTRNFSSIGANTSTAVSIACHRAKAQEEGIELYQLFLKEKLVLPTPMFNIINGGKHAGNALAIQEFMIVPHASSFSEALRIGVEVYHTLKNLLKETKGAFSINVGDEGGFAPPFTKTREALDVLRLAVKRSGYTESEVMFAIDCAASSFYRNGFYEIDQEKKNADELLEYYERLASEYPLISIEDPFYEDDWESFCAITKALRKTRIVGDDLLVSDSSNLKKASEIGACNGVIVKVNQVGTVSRALNTVKSAKNLGYLAIISHRSGESVDDFISHFASGLSTGAIKSGAPARGERVCKYNRLLLIEAREKGALFNGINSIKV